MLRSFSTCLCLGLVAASLVAAGSLPAAELQAFRLPWNDASSGITNLRHWQPEAAGARGRVVADPAGYYTLAGQRIRFLGVNIGAADCFPPADRAAAHAARLARFGFNGVRFHHLEAPWDKPNVLVDYAAGSSRTLNAARLDRLHHFIGQLAAQGLYTNMNLLVSREFQAADGLGPEITQLGWKDQHVLGFFHAGALALHQEYATRLLTAPNPHRGGTPLAQDPAVAFVEIMNENGLLQKWYEGVLDTLPAPYLAALRTAWNDWLATRHSTESALLTAWGAVNVPAGPNTLANGAFNAGTASWNLERHQGAVAEVSTPADFNGAASARISVTSPGTAGWHVQFTHGGQSLVKDQIYTFSFWARAADATPLTGVLSRSVADWAAVSPSLNTTLGPAWREYSQTFVAGANEPNVRMLFNGFGHRTATVWIANVNVRTGGRIGGLAEGESLAARTIAPLRRNAPTPAPTTEQTRDWIRFVFDRERAYWNTMRDHLRSLGYAGIVFGTIIANGPANPQADLDAFDSHGYWQHPQFPANSDWDPVNWTVANVSIVNSPADNLLTAMARQRIAGRPHNVTEYQHPSPNTYGSEGPLLAAAYGALQDWDSLWMFAYNTGTTDAVQDFFDHGGHAGKMTNNLLAAALFRRGDASPAVRAHQLALTPAIEVEVARTSGRAWSIADGSHLGMPATTALVSRTSLTIGDNAVGQPAPAAPAPGRIVSDTGQLAWDLTRAGKGVVTIDTPRTKAVVGFIDRRTFDLGGVVIAPDTTRQDWATIGLTLLDGADWGSPTGAQAVLVATGDQENTGQIWKDATRTSVGANWGTAPVRIEVIPATIMLPVDSSRVQAWSLDGRGQKLAAVPVGRTDGRATLPLGLAGATLWYQIDIAPGFHPLASGSGVQVGFDITHPNGRHYDQVLLTGPTATLTAAPGRSTRLSFLDLNDDIVQLEFSGAGTATVTLANPSGPDLPVRYNQAVAYLKGHATVAITGADASTNLLITSVGRFTAFDPTGAWDLARPVSGTNDPAANANPIFRAGETYDGIADLALITVASTDGRFGGLFCAGAGFFAAAGRTGIDAPGVEFTGRVLIHDLNASGTATPLLRTGAVGTGEPAGSDFRGKLNIAGGDLLQPNAAAVEVGDLEKVKFRDNRNSHYLLLPAQANRARYTRNGTDVTAQVVENPTP